MANKLTWDREQPEGTVRYTVESAVAIATDNPHVLNLLLSLEALRMAIILIDFNCKVDPGDPLLFSYKFEAADGRKWIQTLRFPVGLADEPWMAFNVQDAWLMAEIDHHRLVREHIIALIRSHGVTKVTGTVTP